MENLIIFAVVMLISSLVKPKKRGTDTKPANKQTPINTGKQRGRNRKNIFEQMELELKNLTEKTKPTMGQSVYKREPEVKSFKQEVQDLIKEKEKEQERQKATEPKPFLEDSFAYYNEMPVHQEVSPIILEDIKPTNALDLKKAIIMSEILDKPLYMRKRR